MKKSAGILLYRFKNKTLELMLVHPGGPFYSKKDSGAWSIPKGELATEESPFYAAKREFYEETGKEIQGAFIELIPVKQKNGKVVFAWAVEGDFDATSIVSNTFAMEWPPGSKKVQDFPEVDKAAWFTTDIAKKKINGAQALLIDELVEKLNLTTAYNLD